MGDDAEGRKRRSAYGGRAADSSWVVAPAKAELGTNFAREAAGRGHDARFNFDFLRLAVELGE